MLKRGFMIKHKEFFFTVLVSLPAMIGMTLFSVHPLIQLPVAIMALSVAAAALMKEINENG